jgi:hypothetical protein
MKVTYFINRICLLPSKFKNVFLKEIHILILKLFVHLQQVFTNVSDAFALSIVLSLNFPILTAISKPLFVLYESDKIWLLSKNDFDCCRPRGQPLRAAIFSNKVFYIKRYVSDKSRPIIVP